MSTLNVPRLLLLTVFALWSAAPAHGPQRQPAPAPAPASDQEQQQEQDPPPARPAPDAETRRFVLGVTVTGTGRSTEAPVNGATVTIFAAGHKESRTTDTSGKVTFEITTTARALVLRVVADEWQPHQQEVPIDGTEKSQKVVLRPSD
jgi:hypothetical protein